MYAIRLEQTEIVRLLLDNGAATTASLSTGWSALHYAAEIENPEIATLLLDKGAAVNVVNPQRQEFYAQPKHAEFLEFLRYIRQRAERQT